MRRRQRLNQEVSNLSFTRHLPKAYIIFFGIALAGNILMAVSASTKSVELASIEQELSDIQKEKSIIESQLIKTQSLAELSKKTEELELEKPEAVLYIGDDSAVASL